MPIIIKDKDEALSYIEGASQEEKRFITKQLSFLMPNAYFIPSVRAGIRSPYKQFFKLHEDKIVIPKGLISNLIKTLDDEGFKYVYDKTIYTDKVPSKQEFKEFVKSLNIPFSPYDYQLKAAYESIINYRQINLMATGSGKSLTIYILIRWFLSQNFKSVIIVPSIMLTTQIFQDFKDYGWVDADTFIRLIGGENKIKIFDKPVTISTWQSLYNSPKLFEDLDVVIVDEVHAAKADTFENIIFKASVGARYRLGFTGTLPKDAIDKVTIISSIGQDKRYISTRELIDRGLATPALIKAIFLEYSNEDRYIVKSKKYQDEVKFLTEHIKRNTVLSKMINKISESGNTIVLFDRKEHGKELCLNTFEKKYGYSIDIKELMKADNPYGIYYIIGDSKASEREKIRVLLEHTTNSIVFGTSSILSTGINIKNLHSLMLVSGGKSSVKLNQSIGRLLRTHVSKSTVYIWDIIDDLTIPGKSSTHKNYFYKHFEERLMEYQDSEHPIEEKSIRL